MTGPAGTILARAPLPASACLQQEEPATASRSVTGSERQIRSHAPEPPSGTPPTMTVRALADVQNRLFLVRRAGHGRTAECCVLSEE